mgnify:CR=1 FL=1
MLIYFDDIDAKLILKLIDTEERFSELPKEIKRVRESLKVGLQQYDRSRNKKIL